MDEVTVHAPATVSNVVCGFDCLGFALAEARVVDPASGAVLNANLEEYKVPTVADIPPIHHLAANLPDVEANPTGAKGIGEPPLVPTAPAIASAIFDATGVRLRSLPLTRAALLNALAAPAAPEASA